MKTSADKTPSQHSTTTDETATVVPDAKTLLDCLTVVTPLVLIVMSNVSLCAPLVTFYTSYFGNATCHLTIAQ